MQPQIELQFYWKYQNQGIKEAIIAVTKAVTAGYNTKERLLTALPQFSTYRIALAIDALITADMAENNLGVLTIHPDMDVVLELLKGKYILPLSVEDTKTPGVRRILLNKLGCKNPAGVEVLMNTNISEA